MIKEEDIYKIGKLGKPHGVQGEVSFHFTDDVFDRVDVEYLILKLDGIFVPFFMEEYRFHGSETALIKFEDIDSQDRAKELTGCEVYFPRHLSDSDEENISWAEIVGFALIDAATGNTIGTIQGVDDSTINTLFDIETENHQNILIPASDDLLQQVDADKREIIMNLPEGILDLD